MSTEGAVDFILRLGCCTGLHPVLQTLHAQEMTTRIDPDTLCVVVADLAHLKRRVYGQVVLVLLFCDLKDACNPGA
jgi:hypothetical protein